MSAPVGGSSGEQVWTGLKYWPPDDTNRQALQWGPMSGGQNLGACTVGSHVWKGIREVPARWRPMSGDGPKGFLYCQIQSITGNGYMRSPWVQNDWHTDMTKNIAFPQLRCWAVNIHVSHDYFTEYCHYKFFLLKSQFATRLPWYRFVITF